MSQLRDAQLPRRIFRLLLFLAVCLFFLLGCGLMRGVLLWTEPSKPARWLARLTQAWARSLLWSFGLQVSCSIPPNAAANRNCLLVSNHQSYLDILIIAAHCPTLFVAKSEVSRWPLLGWLASLGGTIFIKRANTHSNVPAVYRVSRILRQGVNVLVFPEGTTSNGTRVLPFQPLFFAASQRARVPVQAITINFTSVNEAPLDDLTRDWLCWHGEKDFVRHFWRLLGLRSAAAELVLHEPHQRAHHSNARTLAQQAQETITSAFAAKAQPSFQQSRPTWLTALKVSALTLLKRQP
jgi:1-acyl-sn-glycerol-3-phosphate acyltransferase